MPRRDHAETAPQHKQQHSPAVSDPVAARSEQRGVIVLGMHRAGTSAVTKILVDIGFDLAGEPLPANWDNPKGYWEPLRIVEIHNEFLRAIGRSWSDPRPLTKELFRSEAAAAARQNLDQTMEAVAQPHERWVLKDPRMCRLMPLWHELLAKGSKPHFLHILRSPLSVAASLMERDGFSLEKGLLLWLRHNLEAEAATRGEERTWLHFEKLVDASPAYVIERFRTVAGSHHLSVKRLQDAIEGNLDHTLVHHEHDHDESPERLQQYPWISRAYQAFGQLGTDREPTGLAALDELQAELHNADALLLGDPVLWEEELHGERYLRLNSTIEHFHRSVEAQRREIETQRAELDAMREAFAVDREQQATARHQVMEQHASMAGWHNQLTQHQEAAEGQRRHLVESIGGLAEQLKQLALSHQADDEATQRRGQHLETLVETQRREIEAQRAEIDAMREAFAAEREQLAAIFQEITRQQRAAESWRDQAAHWQREEESWRQGITESLAGAGGHEQIAAISERTSAIEKLITERLEKQHLSVLSKSLETIAHIETHWLRTRDQLAEVTQERDAAFQNHDRTSAERDHIRAERDAAHHSLDTTRQELDAIRHELDVALQRLDAERIGRESTRHDLEMTRHDLEMTRHDLETTRQQLETSRQESDNSRRESDTMRQALDETMAEVNQLLQRRSWKVTAPLRWLYKVLNSPLRR